VEDWRVRYCGEPATAVALAAEHEHVALVALSAAAEHIRLERIVRVPMSGISGWTVRLDLLYRRGDRDDAVVRALAAAIEAA
jgi:DNA-binding transcriptional LysR family regulator